MDRYPVHVRSPSRLHFGLLSFGHAGRQFGGVGVMISPPTLDLVLQPARQFEVCGELNDEMTRHARLWMEARQRTSLPRCRLELLASPRRHVGLGSGTQLAFAVAAGLNAFENLPPFSPDELAGITRRGRRSAVGTYGFLRGGLIVEYGRLADEPLSPLGERIEIPDQWRFVLVIAGDRRGLSGEAEKRAFAALSPVSQAIRDNLIDEVQSRMIPALRAKDCDAFGESVYRYGHTAGMCFAEVQGGPYNGPHLEKLVRDIRSLGVKGVGQSSWGPTLFCIVPDEASAARLENELASRNSPDAVDVLVASPDNRGAVIRRAARVGG